MRALIFIKNNCINSKDISYNNEDFISIANFIFTEISNMLYSSKVGKIKLGTSSPSYIDYSKKCPKTPDGRKDFEKFHIHISKDNAKDYSNKFYMQVGIVRSLNSEYINDSKVGQWFSFEDTEYNKNLRGYVLGKAKTICGYANLNGELSAQFLPSVPGPE